MAVKVKCTGCQKVLTAPDEARGKAIKCPNCQTRVSVPAADAAPAKKKKSAAAASAAPDSESAIASLDLRSLEDKEARICPKCGYDMSHYDEETTECPKCGYDTAAGGLGEKARKKQLKGPDPDKFYAGMWKGCWKFVGVNQALAWRTILYTLIFSVLMFGSLFLYLYISPVPPRAFFALCAVVSAMMIPGWLWFLDEQIVANTLMRKDKLKRINLDIFLCAALGVKSVMWHVLFAGPLLAIPALVGWALVQFGGLPTFVPPIVVGVCYLPVLSMLPIVIGHMVMPVQTPGWMFWKVIPAWLRVLKPCLLWLMLLLFTNLPAIACLSVIGAVSGPSLQQIAQQMDHNAAIARAKTADENMSAKDPNKGKDPLIKEEFTKVNYFPLILPGALWLVACLSIGFPAVYLMRLNGQLVYFFRDQLDMITLAKEYKYVAKERKDEDEEEAKPKTMPQVLVESIIVVVACVLIGAVFGMVTGSLSNTGLVPGILMGLLMGCSLAGFIGGVQLIIVAFKQSVGWGLIVLLVPCGALVYVIKFWQDARGPFLTSLFANVTYGAVLGGTLAAGVAMPGMFGGVQGGNQPVQEAPVDPAAGANPGAPQIEGQNLPGAEVLN